MNKLTEQEAKQKWCPFVRLAADNVATSSGFNRHVSFRWNADTGGYDIIKAQDQPTQANCIASQCMAWVDGGDGWGGCGMVGK